jgi:hypothetical protein
MTMRGWMIRYKMVSQEFGLLASGRSVIHYPPENSPSAELNRPENCDRRFDGTTRWSRVQLHLQCIAARERDHTGGSYTEIPIPFA